ncbi:hypothetical protein [Rossellomorea sp. NS-SX7]|uniref:hypothetical protein n=1 Tax=Rossellomorea sp. NS-SX7 TaxID=3463856 RepID=UPI004058A3B2
MNSSKKSWTESEEKLLMNTVHSYLDRGLPKKEAFKEVAAKINRSAATCSHRYYAIRKTQPSEMNDSLITLQDCIQFLNDTQQPETLTQENESLKKEKRELLQVQKQLKERYITLMGKHEKLQQLLSIIKEAENYEEPPSAPVIH